MAERVLVTGGLGFIGSRLCSALLDEGVGVRCVDDLSGHYAPGVGPAARAALEERGAEVVVAPAVPEHVEGTDAVLHLAGLPGVRTRRSPAALRQANADLTGLLVEAAAGQGARFVLVSSSSVYGQAVQLPTPEDAPLAPLNAYAASKATAERLVWAAASEQGADALVARPFTVYGPSQRPEMAFARWIAAIEADLPVPFHAPPGAARDFTFVDDAVAGILAALRRGRAGQAYNISGWESHELREALDLLGARELMELPAGGAEARVTAGCNRKAARELRYRPRVTLAEGLRLQLAASCSRPAARDRARAARHRSGSGSGAAAPAPVPPPQAVRPAVATSRG
jgi:nucleoside-diphosphate-sugar epimerase